MNGEVLTLSSLEMNGDSIQSVTSPDEENGDSIQMAVSPEENGDVVQMIPESKLQDTLKLPRRSYPVLRVPWVLLLVEATGLCRCWGRRKVRRRTYQMLVLALTFLSYMSYYMTRRTLSAVKSFLDPSDCHALLNTTNSSDSFNTSVLGPNLVSSYQSNLTEPCPPGWEPFNGPYGKTFLGVLDYTVVLSYAIAMYISGVIADRTPLRYFLAVGMLGSVLANVLFGVAFWANIHFLAYFIVVQIIGGAFQSTGWPGVVAVMSNWFGKGNRGLVMGLWSCHYSLGNILGLLIAAYFAAYGWKVILEFPKTRNPSINCAISLGWAFIATATVMMLVTALTFLLLPAEPQVVGLAPAKTDQNQKNVKKGERKSVKLKKEEAEDKQKQKQNAIGFCRALLIPGVIEYSLALFFTKLVSYTFLFWLPFYISKNSKFPITNFESAWIAVFFDIGGIFGNVGIGLLADFLQVRAIPTFGSLILSVPMLVVYRSFGGISQGAAISLVMLTGVFVSAPFAIITTTISADLGTHKSLKENHKATATVSGIINGTGSLGAACGPLLTGVISTYTSNGEGWQNVFYLLMASSFLAALCTLRLVVSEVTTFAKWIQRWRLSSGTYALRQE